MKPVSTLIHNDARYEELSLFVDNAPSIEELTVSWINLAEGNMVDFRNDGNKNRVCVSFESRTFKSEEQKPEIECFYDYEEIRKQYSTFPLVESFILPLEKTKMNGISSKEAFDIDDKKLQAFAKEKGFYYHEGMYETASSISNMIPYMMMFALSDSGYAEVSVLEDLDVFMDSEEINEENIPENIFWCHSAIGNKNRNFYTHFDTYFLG